MPTIHGDELDHDQSGDEDQLDLPFDLETKLNPNDGAAVLQYLIFEPRAGYEYAFLHMVPSHDLYPHNLVDHCWCDPEPEEEDGEDIWVHNAADGRQAYESGARKPH